MLHVKLEPNKILTSNEVVMDRLTKSVIFMISEDEFKRLQSVVAQSHLNRSEVLRRVLRIGLPVLAQVGFPGNPTSPHDLTQH